MTGDQYPYEAWASVLWSLLPEWAPVDEVARILATAERPLIIAGGGAARVGATLAALAERLGAPVVTTLNGKAAVSERHPLSIGSELRLTGAHALINRSDAVRRSFR